MSPLVQTILLVIQFMMVLEMGILHKIIFGTQNPVGTSNSGLKNELDGHGNTVTTSIYGLKPHVH